MVRRIFLCITICLSIVFKNNINAQKAKISLEDIWSNGKFSAKGIDQIRSMNDGLHYTVAEREKGRTVSIKKHSYETGNPVAEIFNVSQSGGNLQGFDSYEFNDDETALLLSTNTEGIYRYSSKSNNYIFNLQTGKIFPLSDVDKQMYAHFSPKGNKIGYVINNDLYFKDLNSNHEIRITDTGKKNEIINGGSDWVYEEEFVLVRAFEWSPDGNFIAFLEFDESEVPQFSMPIFGGSLYPHNEEFKYPKVGENNSRVKLFVYNTVTGAKSRVKIDRPYEYIPRIGWTPDGKLYYMLMNRLQNELEVRLLDIENQSTKTILAEKSDTYIEIEKQSEFHFLKDGKTLVTISESDGYFHIVKINTSLDAGTTGHKTQITKGNWEVDELYGVEESTGYIYFSSTEASPLERHLYRIKTDGTNKQKLTKLSGTHRITFSKGFKYFIDSYSDKNNPRKFILCDASGNEKRVLENNDALRKKIEETEVSKAEFFSFKTSENIDLNGYMIKPANFDPTKKYPIFMHVYGGPGSQMVKNEWGGADYFWFQHLAQNGYIVVSVDGRGTGARGKKFRVCTYGQLGKLETDDQIEAAKWLGKQPYVDKDRIGIFGWSYGGYMSSLCITRGADVFKAAIAVAPVTNWKFYDTIYTERYMGTKESNPTGYDENAPINFADKLKGSYLLVHGTADDNVHWQNTAEFVNALVKNNKQFDLFLYPDRNHGIYGGNTRLHLYTMMTNFLLKNL
jgi:dipeptidyl-peptidase-4